MKCFRPLAFLPILPHITSSLACLHLTGYIVHDPITGTTTDSFAAVDNGVTVCSWQMAGFRIDQNGQEGWFGNSAGNTWHFTIPSNVDKYCCHGACDDKGVKLSIRAVTFSILINQLKMVSDPNLNVTPSPFRYHAKPPADETAKMKPGSRGMLFYPSRGDSTTIVYILQVGVAAAVDFQYTSWTCSQGGQFDHAILFPEYQICGGCPVTQGVGFWESVPPGDCEGPGTLHLDTSTNSFTLKYSNVSARTGFCTPLQGQQTSGCSLVVALGGDCSVQVSVNCTFDPLPPPPAGLSLQDLPDDTNATEPQWVRTLTRSTPAECAEAIKDNNCIGSDPAPPADTPPKDRVITFMVAGDSISHGMEADYTWRFRVWNWLKSNGYHAQFVGPFQGTNGPPAPGSARPNPPTVPGEAPFSSTPVVGLYNRIVPGEFAAMGHASYWGRQAVQSRDTMFDWVSKYQPDYLLLLLGFNDLGWFVSDALGLIGTMGDLIGSARRAKPNIRILIGNVVDRTFIGGREDLVLKTAEYNARLAYIYNRDWFSWESPIRHIDVHSNYRCTPSSDCDDAYDGLHPNAMGEFHIAENVPFAVPSSVEPRAVSIPGSFQTFTLDEGIISAWGSDPQARSYGYRARVKGLQDWWYDGAVGGTQQYITWLFEGQDWEVTVNSKSDPGIESAWTGLTDAVAHPKTAPGPPLILTAPLNDGIQLAWTAPGGWVVDRYVIITWDKDTPNSWLGAWATRDARFFAPSGLFGHRYSCWVATWIDLPGGLAGGLPSGARDVIVGGSPNAPPNLQATSQDATTFAMTSDTTQQVSCLFPGTWYYEFCVSAYNGNVESPITCTIPPKVGKRDGSGFLPRDSPIIANYNGTMANVSAPFDSSTAHQTPQRVKDFFAKLMQNGTESNPIPVYDPKNATYAPQRGFHPAMNATLLASSLPASTPTN
ncbi:hypothetical protein GQ53DRAFT_804167 [Thozetella sp. PMI_491]|nr:hypothetical protein GQ53DRAFT_804167 [Thozetella sp. PMI_491]